MLNATVNRQVDRQEQEHKVSTKNQGKNLHKSTLKIILFASAMDQESVPTDSIDSCKCIINSKTVALAKQELYLQFKNRDMLDVISLQVILPMGTL